VSEKDLIDRIEINMSGPSYVWVRTILKKKNNSTIKIYSNLIIRLIIGEG